MAAAGRRIMNKTAGGAEILLCDGLGLIRKPPPQRRRIVKRQVL
jgi:hypothetical protein